MYNRDLSKVRLRYARTASEAFKDLSYSTAIERPWPSPWQRFWRAVWGWL